MTTASSSTRIRHDSDATFREWVQEMTAKLAACGLVQTSDTGQIDPVTVARPGTNTSAGYQIWRFNDSLQGTAPIFIRFEYRTGGAATNPACFAGVGTGTNGAGTLTGTASYTATAMSTMSSSQVTDTARNSYWCHTEGAFVMNWKQGSSNTETVFAICRTVDVNGDPTVDGAIFANIASGYLSVRYAKFTATAAISAAFTATTSMNLCHWPFTLTSSTVSGDPQYSIPFAPITPRVMPFLGFVGVLDAEFPIGTSFTATPIGTTAHTYLPTTNFPHLSATNQLKPAIIYE